MIIAGIDPGANGGLAILVESSLVYPAGLTVLPVPKTKGEIDYTEWKGSWEYALSGVHHVFIEKVSARPGQGVTSMFNFGKVFGFVWSLSLASSRTLDFATPQEWKKGVGIPSGSEKGASRIRASQLFPNDADKWSRVKDDGLAEAALIAYYGSLKLRGETK